MSTEILWMCITLSRGQMNTKDKQVANTTSPLEPLSVVRRLKYWIRICLKRRNCTCLNSASFIMLNPYFVFFKYRLKLAIKELRELGSYSSLLSFFRTVMINSLNFCYSSWLVLQRQKFLKQSNILLSFFVFSFSWSSINCSTERKSAKLKAMIQGRHRKLWTSLWEAAPKGGKTDAIFSLVKNFVCGLWLTIRYFSLVRKIVWPIRLFLVFDRPLLLDSFV